MTKIIMQRLVIAAKRGDEIVFRKEGEEVPEGLSLTFPGSLPNSEHWWYREGNKIWHYHECFDFQECESTKEKE